MAGNRELKVIISGDASSLNKAFKSVDKGASGLGKGLKTLGKVAALGVGAAFAGLAVTLKAGFDEVAEGQQVLAQTNAVLKSTGGVANVTAKDVDKLAQSLSQLTGVDDEAVQATENLLLTFKNIRNEQGKGNDIFNQTTAAVLDMTTAMNNGAVPSVEQLNSGSIRLGKALNDPVKGITALTKVGVTFTEAQKAQIAEMVKSGDVMGAQKLILQELNSEFGGAAAAAGQTLPGQLAKLRNSFSEVAGEIFTTLLPYLMQFLDWVNRNMPTIQRVIQVSLDAVVATINFLGPIIQKLIGWFQRLSQFAQRHWDEVQEAADRVMRWYRGTLEPAIQNVIRAITAIWNRFGADIVRILRTSLASLTAVVRTILGNLASIVNAIMAVLRGDWSEAWSEIKEIPGRTLKGVVAVIRGFIGIFKTAGIAIGKAVMEGIAAGFTSLFESVKNSLTSKMEDLKNALKNPWHIGSPSKVTIEIGKQIAAGLGVGFGQGMVTVEEQFGDRINNAIDHMVTAVTNRKNALADAFSELTSNALAAFDKLNEGFKTKSEKALEALDLKEATRQAQERIQELTDAVTKAQDNLRKALATGPEIEPQRQGESAEDFNKRRIEAEERYQEQLRQLREQEGSAIAALTEEQRQQALAKERQRLEKLAAQERKALEDRRALQRRHFEEELAALQRRLDSGKIKTEQAQQEILKLFKKYHIPFKDAAGLLGSALAEGLRDSFADVRRATRELANTIADELAKIKIVVDVSIKRSASGKDNNKTPGRALGGPVRQGNLYVVGERGPEFFVPNQSGTIIPNGRGGGGGNTYIVNFPNYLGDKRDLEKSLQQMMRRFEDSNGISFTGRSL